MLLLRQRNGVQAVIINLKKAQLIEMRCKLLYVKINNSKENQEQLHFSKVIFFLRLLAFLK